MPAHKIYAFYGDALGLPLLYRFGGLVFFDLAGVRLMLSAVPEPDEDASIPPEAIQRQGDLDRVSDAEGDQQEGGDPSATYPPPLHFGRPGFGLSSQPPGRTGYWPFFS